MSDLFDDFTKIFKKDLVPIFIKYLRDPNNKITDKLNDLINDLQNPLAKIFEKFSTKEDNDNNEIKYTDIKATREVPFNYDYEDLYKRLISIEENMIQIEKILKAKN